ncbi:MAG: amphi-Trp domain-containing protein [Pseudomonadota bacterium]
MDVLEIADKEILAREAAAERLRSIADSLARHNGLRLRRGAVVVDVNVADTVEFELEVDIESDGSSIEIEISW